MEVISNQSDNQWERKLGTMKKKSILYRQWQTTGTILQRGRWNRCRRNLDRRKEERDLSLLVKNLKSRMMIGRSMSKTRILTMNLSTNRNSKGRMWMFNLWISSFTTSVLSIFRYWMRKLWSISFLNRIQIGKGALKWCQMSWGRLETVRTSLELVYTWWRTWWRTRVLQFYWRTLTKQNSFFYFSFTL